LEKSSHLQFYETLHSDLQIILVQREMQVQLFIYFMLKFAMEILVSESSVVTAHYFQWSIHSVAMFLALLGLTVLPVNWVIGSYASNIFQDR